MPLGLLRIIAVCFPSMPACKLPREYGNTEVRRRPGVGDMDTSNGCLWSLTSWQAKYFLAVPMCRQCGFYGYSRACRSDVSSLCCCLAPCSLLPRTKGHPIPPPSCCHGIVIAASDLDLRCGENTTRYLNSSFANTFSFYLCQAICISEKCSQAARQHKCTNV